MATLRELREKKYISQEELAKRTGVAKATINRLEKEHQKPRWVTIRKLAAALGVEPGQIDFSSSAEKTETPEKPTSKARWNQPAPKAEGGKKGGDG